MSQSQIPACASALQGSLVNPQTWLTQNNTEEASNQKHMPLSFYESANPSFSSDVMQIYFWTPSGSLLEGGKGLRCLWIAGEESTSAGRFLLKPKRVSFSNLGHGVCVCVFSPSYRAWKGNFFLKEILESTHHNHRCGC